MTAESKDATFSHVIDVVSLDAAGLHVVLEPGESERKAIADRLEIPSLNRLKGDFAVTPFAGGVEVRLILDAEAERQCVVSLEPMTETTCEETTMRFEKSFEEDANEDEDGSILREPLEGDVIDLGEILVQTLSLALDPYPRKDSADAHLEKYRDAAPASPFDALKGLFGRDR